MEGLRYKIEEEKTPASSSKEMGSAKTVTGSHSRQVLPDTARAQRQLDGHRLLYRP